MDLLHSITKQQQIIKVKTRGEDLLFPQRALPISKVA